MLQCLLLDDNTSTHYILLQMHLSYVTTVVVIIIYRHRTVVYTLRYLVFAIASSYLIIVVGDTIIPTMQCLSSLSCCCVAYHLINISVECWTFINDNYHNLQYISFANHSIIFVITINSSYFFTGNHDMAIVSNYMPMGSYQSWFDGQKSSTRWYH